MNNKKLKAQKRRHQERLAESLKDKARRARFEAEINRDIYPKLEVSK